MRGIGIFTARPGMGKTYALRCFMGGLNPNQYQTAYINLSTISVRKQDPNVQGDTGAGVLSL